MDIILFVRKEWKHTILSVNFTGNYSILIHMLTGVPFMLVRL